MGSKYYEVTETGTTASTAFWKAVNRALLEDGNSLYTGTISSKYEFVMAEYASADHPDFQDKGGPAGCVQDGPTTFTFFGHAPW